MKSNTSIPKSVVTDIEYYLGFLFQRGYQLQDMKKLPMGDWEVTLVSMDIKIAIYSDQGEINLAFAPKDSTDRRDRIGIRSLIYFLSKEKRFIGRYRRSIFNNQKKRFEELANLLKEYIDEITPLFGRDFEKYSYDLVSAQKKYNELYLDTYIPRRASHDRE